jgi:acyl-CoA thioester hydrolase
MRQGHRTDVQIRFNDIDLMGHVYNAKYQEFFDLARLAYFDEVLGEKVILYGTGLVIASVKVDYLQPTFLDDEIHVITKISKLGDKSLEMNQTVFKQNAEESVATCTSIMVCYDMQKRNSEFIPKDWKEKIKTYENNLDVN